MIERSAEAVTVVTADEVLSPGPGSLVLAETVALFMICPVVIGAVAVRVSIGAAPTARLLRLHVTTPALGGAGVQVQPVPLEFVYVTPEGRVSATDTFAAVLGPMFVTASV